MEPFSTLVNSFLSKLMEKSFEYTLSGSHKTTLESLENNVRLLSAKKFDFEKAIERENLSGRKKRKREVEQWFEQVKDTEVVFETFLNELETKGFFMRFFTGGEAAKLNARVHELIEQTKDFGELVVDDWDAKGEEFQTKEMVGREFDENFKKIWNLLVIEKVSSIGIYGMGGAGKTTLAQHINNQLVNQNEAHVVWVTVSQEFSVRVLQDKMAKQLHLDLSEESNEDIRARRLNKALSMKKSLVLILDDVWKGFDLGKLGDPPSIDGCRLLVTSRFDTVCSELLCKQLIKVEKLPEDEAWKLFKETLGQKTKLIGEMQTIAEFMQTLGYYQTFKFIEMWPRLNQAQAFLYSQDVKHWRSCLWYSDNYQIIIPLHISFKTSTSRRMRRNGGRSWNWGIPPTVITCDTLLITNS